MASEEETLVEAISLNLIKEFEEESGLEWHIDLLEYAMWLELKIAKLSLHIKSSQPSTTTPSDDVAAGHGAC